MIVLQGKEKNRQTLGMEWSEGVDCRNQHTVVGRPDLRFRIGHHGHRRSGLLAVGHVGHPRHHQQPEGHRRSSVPRRVLHGVRARRGAVEAASTRMILKHAHQHCTDCTELKETPRPDRPDRPGGPGGLGH